MINCFSTYNSIFFQSLPVSLHFRTPKKKSGTFACLIKGNSVFVNNYGLIQVYTVHHFHFSLNFPTGALNIKSYNSPCFTTIAFKNTLNFHLKSSFKTQVKTLWIIVVFLQHVSENACPSSGSVSRSWLILWVINLNTEVVCGQDFAAVSLFVWVPVSAVRCSLGTGQQKQELTQTMTELPSPAHTPLQCLRL
jgi:hypothetical protein